MPRPSYPNDPARAAAIHRAHRLGIARRAARGAARTRQRLRDDPGTPPRAAKRRARRWSAILLGTTAALTVVPVTVVRLLPSHSHGPLVLAFLGSCVPYLLPVLCLETRDLTVGHGPDGTLLSARTWTGRRTVDLDALVRVRLFHLPDKSPGRSLDTLIVTDAHGVRIGLSSTEAVDAVRDALRRTADRGPAVPVRVGRGARRLLAHRFASPWDVVGPTALLLTGCLALFGLCVAAAGA